MTPAFAPRTADLTALEPLLRQLKGGRKDSRRVVLELRHHDWLSGRHREETTAFLKEQGATLASIDGPPADAKHFTIMPAVDVVTHFYAGTVRSRGGMISSGPWLIKQGPASSNEALMPSGRNS